MFYCTAPILKKLGFCLKCESKARMQAVVCKPHTFYSQKSSEQIMFKLLFCTHFREKRTILSLTAVWHPKTKQNRTCFHSEAYLLITICKHEGTEESSWCQFWRGIFVWCTILTVQQSQAFFAEYLVQLCIKCFQLVRGLDWEGSVQQLDSLLS